ncbi:PREDICTED: prolactin-inducible protein [Galeopterus variegatus]|uniref:Prolactin-inducible protein homolog n=1 Tax=Galeopterus variegatus TaxID=482537 RepID=A0ABM0RQR4_GALVR|nr:PREDICTED: prolactin-inducible protein [Galeopterus variegatus]
MRYLQLLFRASPAALLLVLCLQLGTSKAQEDTPRPIIMDLQMPQEAEANEIVSLALKVKTELKECMVIKAHLESSVFIGGSFNYKFTGCLCEDYPRTFFWDFRSNSTTKIAAIVDIVRELGICPNDDAVVPIKANRYYTITTLVIS